MLLSFFYNSIEPSITLLEKKNKRTVIECFDKTFKVNKISKKKDFMLAEGVTISMIWVEPGAFIMGSPYKELGRTPEREAQHKVTITKGYWLAETELTQLQWQKIMEVNPSFNKGDNLPVDQVSFSDIQEFLKKINTIQNKFRLPTEAEWEFACRAGSIKPYGGNIDAMVWHRGNSGIQSHPVASKKPNAWGFYDMQGNILEWCSDWFQEDTTKDTINPEGPETGIYKVQRGGQFTGRSKHTRAADRQRSNPNKRDFYVGFRLTRNAGD